jgi:hypothetical protein
MEQEKRIGRKMYWDNEKVQYNEEDIDKIIKDYNIACVVTASSPSFAYPGMNAFRRSTWAEKDKALIKDITEERIIMDKIYNKVVENSKKPYIWAYSRFKSSNQNMINDILFQSLNMFQFLHFNSTAATFFKVDFSEMLKENEYVAEEMSKIKTAFTYSNPWDEDTDIVDGEEPMDEEQAEGEDDELDEILDDVLVGDSDNGRAVEANELRVEDILQAREAPGAWNTYVIDHDGVLRSTNETVREMREVLDRFTADFINTNITDNTNNMTYYDPATLRGAVSTDDGERHG